MVVVEPDLWVLRSISRSAVPIRSTGLSTEDGCCGNESEPIPTSIGDVGSQGHLGRCSPIRARAVVVFPLPELPMTVTTPAGISRSM